MVQYQYGLVLVVLTWCSHGLLAITSNLNHHHDVLSRHKRFVTFPEGSAITFVVCCNSVAPFAEDIFTFGVDMDMSWDLPNDTRVLSDQQYETEAQQRSDRSELYFKLEQLLSAVGLDGKACVLRTMCEVTRQLETVQDQGGLMEELIRLIFTLPETGSPNLHDVPYDEANHRGRRDVRPCEELFSGCPISLLDLL